MTYSNVKEIEDLIKIISKLPGLGPKSAKRIVLKLINNREELIKPLTNTLAQVYKNVVRCKICGNLKSTNTNCICSSNKYEQICVVENIADIVNNSFGDDTDEAFKSNNKRIQKESSSKSSNSK